ncbi:MAG: 6-bladed beta-propeller [Candidatus Aminicenantes bacterium]|nr:MAG: 6-bladed beta-propeller [Candidatus Aminicenantes bacterium]
MMKPIIISFLLLLLCIILPAVELKFIDQVMLTGGGEDDFIKAVGTFAVTEDGLYLVVDLKEGDIKIFDLKGRFVKRVGGKGHGPGEFIQPRGCDYLDRQLVVMDLDRRVYMLLNREKDSMLKESKLLRYVYVGNDVALMKNEKLLMEGYKADKDGKEWGLFTYDFKTRQYDYLVPKEIKFGFKTVKDYKKVEEDISTIGSSGYCDWWGEYAYLAWRGDLKVFNIHMKTKRIQTFGKKTDNYRQPAATHQLRKALRERNIHAYKKESDKFSTLIGIFTNKNYLLLTYSKPIAGGEKVKSRMLQFYTLAGDFINELQITRGEGCGLYLSKDRDDDILYMLQIVYGDDDETDEKFKITRFKMVK